jgi:thiamine kinase-like enzyme
MRRNLGEASTPAEGDLEQAVSQIGDWKNAQIAYQPVVGGISNSNWRVFVGGHDVSYFVKIPGQGTEMFIDRDAAHDASVKAYQAGVSAKVYHYLPDSGVEVIEFVDGLRTSTNGDFLNDTVRRNAVGALRDFNNGEALNLRKTLFDMIDEHIGQALGLGGHFPQDFGWINAKYRKARAALEASGLDIVPCMNDTLAGNFLLDDDNNVMLVDFEYASGNDRCAELAVWFGEMFFPADVERQVIEEYFGEASETIVSRITVFKALADLKWSTWAMVQNKVSQLDFDFFKYGVWKHMRARAIMRDPLWDSWLSKV